MAENIRKQIQQGQIQVTHKHLQDWVNLPEWMRQCADHLDSEQELADCLREQGVLLGVLHAGLRDSVIQTRARARAVKKDTEGNEEVWIDHQSAEATIPNPLPDPEKSKSKKSESPQEYIERRKAEGASKKKIMEELGL
jgi:hypothetical protein